MASKYTYGYLKEAVRAHLDLEEDELEVMNINQRFHIFANEAIQAICDTRPKYRYFEFEAVAEFTPLVYDDGTLRVATAAEILANTMTFATADELAAYYNALNIYLIGQVINVPEDFLSFAAKKSFLWTTYITSRVVATKEHITYLSTTELIVNYAANYQIPYRASWMSFAQDYDDNDNIAMPDDLALTIPIYVASVMLEQRNLNMANAKRQAFEIAVRRTKSTSLLENLSVTSSFE